MLYLPYQKMFQTKLWDNNEVHTLCYFYVMRKFLNILIKFNSASKKLGG